MKKKALQLLLATATLAAAAAAHAATTIDAGAFSLAQQDWYPGNIDMRIVGQTANSVQILMGNLRPEYPIRVTDTDGSSRGGWEFGGGMLLGSVDQGYRITSLTLSGATTGALDIAPRQSYCDGPSVSCWLGSASNNASVGWSVGQDGQWTALSGLSRSNITQTETFGLTSAVSLGGDFSLQLGVSITAEANAGREYITIDDQSGIRYVPTTAAVDFQGPVMLTVQVAPVPEPGTYAMLLAGLGLLGGAAFRQRR